MADAVRPARIRILGTGRYVPDKVLSNADLERIVDTSDEWIMERTGIKERRIVEDSQANSDMSYPASVRALESAGVDPTDLDAIICATVTPDNPFPSLACKLQAMLGARQAFAFDVSAACSGWIYAVDLAQSLIQTDRARRVLVLGAETLSKIVDWTDRSTCVLFGDGAGATILGPSETPERGILACRLAADGRHYDLLVQPAGGSRRPASHETVEKHQHAVTMVGREVFKHAVRNMVALSKEVLEEAGLSVEDVDLFIPHQANKRIITETARRLGVDDSKLCLTVDRFGNTSSATIPTALDEALEAGRIGEGSVVAVVAFGGGFTYGAAVMRM